MKMFRSLILVYMFSVSLAVNAQSAIDSIRFFTDIDLFNVTLTTDIGNLTSGKIREDYQPATFTCKLADSSVISEQIRVSARGHMRRDICYIPPLRLNFHNATSPKLYSLNSLKLVCACKSSTSYQQYLLKEYLVYKIYNLLTEKSFRVRLLNITYEDSKGKKKSSTQYGFLVENVDAMAKRNHCKEWNNPKLPTETANRDQMTMVALFEYMIGNTDWSVRADHNIKLITSKKDSTVRPFAVPYDFDYSGLVNTDYAVPEPQLGIENVLQRLYRGFPRTMDELQTALEVFRNQKENIYALIENFELLDSRNKQEMTDYLDDFYKTIRDPGEVQNAFINNARQQ